MVTVFGNLIILSFMMWFMLRKSKKSLQKLIIQMNLWKTSKQNGYF